MGRFRRKFKKAFKKIAKSPLTIAKKSFKATKKIAKSEVGKGVFKLARGVADGFSGGNASRALKFAGKGLKAAKGIKSAFGGGAGGSSQVRAVGGGGAGRLPTVQPRLGGGLRGGLRNRFGVDAEARNRAALKASNSAQMVTVRGSGTPITAEDRGGGGLIEAILRLLGLG